MKALNLFLESRKMWLIGERNSFWHLKKIFIIFLFTPSLSAQYLLNGDFELNTGVVGTDELDMNNAQFNAMVQNCYSFGTTSTVNIDMISSGVWDGLAQSGNWYVGIESGNVDRFSMELSESLVAGETYQLSFYDRARAENGIAPVSVGVSSQNNDFGTLIYTASDPEVGVWKLRVFTFIAPINGQFITVRAEDTFQWVKVDNFCLSSEMTCVETPELIMPNVFTPNADGINDNFSPVTFKGIVKSELIVFNRWGQVIFETEDLQAGWDGTFNNAPCKDGVYFWVASYTDIFEQSVIEHGNFTLIGSD